MIRLRKISVRVPEAYVKVMERLVEMGAFSSKSEIVRFAIENLLRKERNRYAILMQGG